MKMLDLFSGIGGFSLAARWAGIETIQFVEKDKFCQKVLSKNFPGVPIHEDIYNFYFNETIDLITGGFPCQPFSVAGNKKGISDERYLWPEFFRLIKSANPNWIIAENVNGIFNMELDNILNDLEREGYETQTFSIPASGAGAPHKRDRLWIIANINRIGCNNWINNWQKRFVQNDWEQYVKAFQPKWEFFKPESWKTFDAKSWCKPVTDAFGNECGERTEDNESKPKRYQWKKLTPKNRGISSFLGWNENKSPVPGVDDGLSNIVDRNKSLGNAIVPQVVFPIIKFIKLMEENKPVI